MIAILNVTYPIHSFKQVVQAFTSPDLPKRPESVRDLASVGYFDDGGGRAVFMFDVPDAQAAEFLLVQSKRSAFIGSRVPGFSSNVHLGQTIGEGIPTLMPLCA